MCLFFCFSFLLQNKNHIKSKCIWDICCKAKAIIGAVKIWNFSINGRFQCDMTRWRSVHVTTSPIACRPIRSRRYFLKQIIEKKQKSFFLVKLRFGNYLALWLRSWERNLPLFLFSLTLSLPDSNFKRRCVRYNILTSSIVEVFGQEKALCNV
jgi:hypothetical protein